MAGSTSYPEDGVTHQHSEGGAEPIFVCDASAEAERLITSLRNRGHAVVDVPLGMLPSRVRYEVPTLVVCDADAHEALLRVDEMKQAAPEAGEIRLLFVGHEDGALKAEKRFGELATGILTRPLNLTATLQLIDDLVGPPARNRHRSRKPRHVRAPVLVPSARKPYRSDSSIPSSAPPVPDDEPAWPISAQPGLGPLLPEGNEGASVFPRSSASSVPPSSNRSRLSSETAALLEAGQRRVAQDPEPQLRQGPMRRLPTDKREISDALLDALQEPLTRQDIVDEDTSLPGLAEADRRNPRYDAALEPPDSKTRSHPGSSPPGSARDEPTSLEVRQSQSEAESTSLHDGAMPESMADDEEPTNPGGRPAEPEPDAMSRPTTRPPALSKADPFQSAGSSPRAEADSQPPKSQDASPPSTPPSTAPDSRRDARTTNQLVLGPELSRPLDDLSDLLLSESPPLGGVSPLAGGFDINLVDLSSPVDSLSRQRLEPIPRAPTPQPIDPGSELPEAAGPALTKIAAAIRDRSSGALAQQEGQGIRRVALRDGDILTVTSSADHETLVEFLVQRGDIPRDQADAMAPLPRFGRHAGAALIAQGILRQDDLWPVLRAHAEWILGAMVLGRGDLQMERNVPARISEEPAVFGGAAGAEVFVDVLKRNLSTSAAFAALGSGQRRLSWGTKRSLLAETALGSDLERRISNAVGLPLERVREESPDLLVVLLALTLLGILSVGGSPQEPAIETSAIAEKSAAIDDEAFARKLLARKALVDDGDYFSLLGVQRGATSYEVDRAFSALEREFRPERLGARHVHLADELELVRRVLEEAHGILRDDTRRARYRAALESVS